MIKQILAASAIFAATAIAPAISTAAESITATSPHSVEKTTANLVAAIKKAGANVFAVVDHQKNAAGADLRRPPTTLVIFGNPKMGTPIMLADRRAGLDLPVRMLIWDDGGTTRLEAKSPDQFNKEYNVDAAAKPLKMMGGALGNLMAAAAK